MSTIESIIEIFKDAFCLRYSQAQFPDIQVQFGIWNCRAGLLVAHVVHVRLLYRLCILQRGCLRWLWTFPGVLTCYYGSRWY